MPRKVKGQTSFLRTADEAKRLFRAVDDLQSVKIRVVEYKKKGGYKYHGILVGHTLLSCRLPTSEAEMICGALKSTLQGICATMGQSAIEIMQGRVRTISHEAKPPKEDPAVVEPEEAATESL